MNLSLKHRHTSLFQQYLWAAFSWICLTFWGHLGGRKAHQQALNWVSKVHWFHPDSEICSQTHYGFLMTNLAALVPMKDQSLVCSLAFYFPQKKKKNSNSNSSFVKKISNSAQRIKQKQKPNELLLSVLFLTKTQLALAKIVVVLGLTKRKFETWRSFLRNQTER